MNQRNKIQSRCLEAEEWIEKFKQYKVFEVLEETRQKNQEKIKLASISVRTEEEQNTELQSQLDRLKATQDTLANECNSILEQERQLNNDRIKQEESFKEQQKRHVELEKALRDEQEKWVTEESKEPEVAADNEELMLALFHGLGLQSKIEGDKVKTVMLTTSNDQDILALALDNYKPEFTANYVWNFISK